MPVAKTKLDLQPIVEIRAVNVITTRTVTEYKWLFFPVKVKVTAPTAWFLEYRRASSQEWTEIGQFEMDEQQVENVR